MNGVRVFLLTHATPALKLLSPVLSPASPYLHVSSVYRLQTYTSLPGLQIPPIQPGMSRPHCVCLLLHCYFWLPMWPNQGLYWNSIHLSEDSGSMSSGHIGLENLPCWGIHPLPVLNSHRCHCWHVSSLKYCIDPFVKKACEEPERIPPVNTWGCRESDVDPAGS